MSTQLVPISSYAVVGMNPEELRGIMTANIGNSGVDEFDIPRIKVPAGGGSAWEVPSLEGPVVQKEVEGVIVAWRNARAFWQAGIDQGSGNQPPDCSSPDGIRGIGDPGGECGPCPMAQFGSAIKDGKSARGQACKSTRLLFVIRPGDMFPVVVVAPPSSLKGVRSYFLQLATKAIPFYGVVTSLALEQDKNAEGIKYSKILPRFVGKLSDEDRARMESYAKTIAPLVQRISVQANDVTAD